VLCKEIANGLNAVHEQKTLAKCLKTQKNAKNGGNGVQNEFS